jgi:hypothetical protein
VFGPPLGSGPRWDGSTPGAEYWKTDGYLELSQFAIVENEVGTPSPQPSPVGRGDRLHALNEQSFDLGTANPLSPRERVRVRGSPVLLGHRPL